MWFSNTIKRTSVESSKIWPDEKSSDQPNKNICSELSEFEAGPTLVTSEPVVSSSMTSSPIHKNLENAVKSLSEGAAFDPSNEPFDGTGKAVSGAPNHSQPKRPERKHGSRSRCGGVALALGGGAAKGWAHIGVLRAIDEFKIPISMIAGTSIGALVGGAYLSGDMDELEEFALSITKRNIIRYLDFTLRGSGLISGSRLARKMEEHMADKTIEDLPIPFVAVATDIRNGHEIWLSDGPMVPAMRASYALPGVFNPIMHGGRQLVDGALVNPVPISVCRAYEPDLAIAVNLHAESFGRSTIVRSSHYDHIEKAMDHDKESQVAGWFSFMQNRDKAPKSENRLGVTQVMVESFNIIQDRIARARLAGDPPDYTVRPKLKDVGLVDFHKAKDCIRLGYEEMSMRLRELQDQGALENLAIS